MNRLQKAFITKEEIVVTLDGSEKADISTSKAEYMIKMRHRLEKQGPHTSTNMIHLSRS